jgi:hypothetical protein
MRSGDRGPQVWVQRQVTDLDEQLTVRRLRHRPLCQFEAHYLWYAARIADQPDELLRRRWPNAGIGGRAGG